MSTRPPRSPLPAHLNNNISRRAYYRSWYRSTSTHPMTTRLEMYLSHPDFTILPPIHNNLRPSWSLPLCNPGIPVFKPARPTLAARRIARNRTYRTLAARRRARKRMNHDNAAAQPASRPFWTFEHPEASRLASEALRARIQAGLDVIAEAKDANKKLEIHGNSIEEIQAALIEPLKQRLGPIASPNTDPIPSFAYSDPWHSIRYTPGPEIRAQWHRLAPHFITYGFVPEVVPLTGARERWKEAIAKPRGDGLPNDPNDKARKVILEEDEAMVVPKYYRYHQNREHGWPLVGINDHDERQHDGLRKNLAAEADHWTSMIPLLERVLGEGWGNETREVLRGLLDMAVNVEQLFLWDEIEIWDNKEQRYQWARELEALRGQRAISQEEMHWEIRRREVFELGDGKTSDYDGFEG